LEEKARAFQAKDEEAVALMEKLHESEAALKRVQLDLEMTVADQSAKVRSASCPPPPRHPHRARRRAGSPPEA
jgi:hypothetical protein